ncbi:MAG TPA: hypothetical protein VG406_05105 [Isosphaeraceae bacterium]|jgi:WD40 repeat protein|nr:hypothetical protein [Isosphaeraceae bacterium]
MSTEVAVAVATCPYPGLRPFLREESDVFFGMEEQVDRILEKLGEHRFLAIVGTSGCGKSSLARAGLIAALEAGLLTVAGPRWRVATMRPMDRPLYNLARYLLEPEALGRGDEGAAASLPYLLATLRRGPLGLVEALREGAVSGRGPRLEAKENLLLLVDQFEEVFRFRRGAAPPRPAEAGATATATGAPEDAGPGADGDQPRRRARDEADAFIALLLATASQEWLEPEDRLPIYVILTMRSDYLGECAVFTGLSEAISDSQFLTPHLSRDQRRASIEGPARVCGGEVEPALVNRLLNDMGSAPDQLPLMQHALMRLWRRAALHTSGGNVALRLGDYDAVGGLNGALDLHADEAFSRLETDRQRAIAEALFRSLAEVDSDKSDTRRPTPLGEVARVAAATPEEVIAVVDVFRAPGLNFLTPPAGVPLDAETRLDISHESLIRQWNRMRRWVRDEARSAEDYRQLERSARRWKANERGTLDTLELENALAWWRKDNPTAAWARRYGGDFELARHYLEVSDRVVRRGQLLRNLALAAAVLLMFIMGLALVLIRKNANLNTLNTTLSGLNKTLAANETQLKTQKDRIEVQNAELSRKATESQSLLLARQSKALLQAAPQRSLFLAVGAIKVGQEGKIPIVPAGEEALRLALANLGGRGYVGPGGALNAVAARPDGRQMAAAGADGTVLLWDLDTGDAPARPPAALKKHKAQVSALVYLDDRRLLSVGYDGAFFWDVTKPGGSPTPALDDDPAPAPRKVSLGPATRRLAAARRATLAPAATAQLSPGRRWLVVPGRDKFLVFDLRSRDRSRPRVLAAPGPSYPLPIPPGDRWFAAKHEGDLSVWDLTDDGSEPRVFKGAEEIFNAAFTLTKDGRRLVANFSYGSSGPRLWDRARGGDDARPIRWDEKSPKLDYHGCVFSPDGRWMIGSATDQGLVFWDLEAAEPMTSWRHPPGVKNVYAMISSVDGRWLGVLDSQGYLRVWDLEGLESGKLEARYAAMNPYYPLAYSPGASIDVSRDGRWLVLRGSQSSVQLWDLRNVAGNSGPITLRGHDEPANAAPYTFTQVRAEFAGDGQALVTAGTDGTARRWPLEVPPGGGASYRSPEGTDPVCLLGTRESPTPGRRFLVLWPSSTFSDDRRWFVLRRDDAIRAWDLSRHDPASDRPTLLLHGDTGLGFALSSDGRWLLARKPDGAGKLWRLDGAKPEASEVVVAGLGGLGSSFTVADDGRWLILPGSADSPLTLLPIREGAARDPIRPRGASPAPLFAVVPPGGKRLVFVGPKDTIRTWDLSPEGLGREPVEARVGDLTSYQYQGTSLASPDGRWLCVPDGAAADIFDLSGPDPTHPRAKLTSPTDTAGAGFPSFVAGGRLVLSDSGGGVTLWELDRETPRRVPLRRPSPPPPAPPLKTQPQATGPRPSDAAPASRIAPAKYRAMPAREPRPVQAPFVQGPTYVMQPVPPSFNPTVLQYDNRRRRVVLNDADGSAQLYDLAAPNPDVTALRVAEPIPPAPANPEQPPMPAAPLPSFEFSRDDRWLVGRFPDGSARLWDLGGKAGARAKPRTLAEAATTSQGAVARQPVMMPTTFFTADGGHLVVLGSGKSFALWSLATGDEPRPISLKRAEVGLFEAVVVPRPDRPTPKGAIPEHDRLIARGTDGSIRSWDLERHDADPVNFSGPSSALGLAVGPGAHRLVTTSPDGTARVWALSLNLLLARAAPAVGRNPSRAEWELDFGKTDYFRLFPELEDPKTDETSQVTPLLAAPPPLRYLRETQGDAVIDLRQFLEAPPPAPPLVPVQP